MKKPDFKITAKIIGILYIIGTVTGTLSVSFLSALKSPDYLSEISKNPNSLIFGALLVLAMGLSLAMIPAFMFPILKKYNEALGIGYVIFRGALETFTYIIRSVGYLALSLLGAAYAAGTRDLSNAGAAVKAITDSSVNAFIFGAGALIFYAALYKYRLIPKWLSGFGIIAVLLHIISGVLVMFGLQENFDTGSLVMNLPIAVQEMIMAVWLIVKGFSKQITEDIKNEIK